MPKNIALFSDGTGNSSATLFKTNVWRLYQALDLSGPDQIAYYDDGVGTSSFKPFAILGGGLGLGLKRNVKQLYAFLSSNYEPGDRIYAFGFSRGAFTIRVLVDLVHDQGLAKKDGTEAELWRDVNDKWWAYRKRARTRILGKVRTWLFGRRARSEEATDPGIKFAFLGLWDTVDAYGLPVDELARAWDYCVWPLSMDDRVPLASIEKAFHALSIDDERNTFHPVLWTETGEPRNETSARLDDERISQVWFAGMHANVGGGYSDDSLAYVSLRWIMDEADRRKLRFQPGEFAKVRAAVAPNGPIFDSRHGLAGYYRYNPRKIEKLVADDFNEVSIARPKIHESVFERLRSGGDRYAPIVLPAKYAVVKANGSIANTVIESASQSQAREAEQERAWNWVWARRVVYFAALASSGYLALFPLLFRAGLDGACASKYFCSLASFIGAVGSVLPGFAAVWFDTFKANPGWFLLGAGFLLTCLFAGGWLSRKIKDTMRLIWKPILSAPNTPVSPAQRPSDFIYWLRNHLAYQAFFRGLTRYVLPGLFAAGIYYSAAALLSRVEFSIFSAAGGVCAESEKSQPVSGVMKFHFEASDPCAASGYTLQEGARYRIWIEIGPDWTDNGIKAGAEGFSREGMSWPMYFALPFRRWLVEPWFKPFARIGARGNDEYPLNPLVPFAAGTPGDKKRLLVTEIRARRNGELFLYVNDALFFWPWLHTYGNNTGTAKVTSERVEAPPIPSDKAPGPRGVNPARIPGT